MTSENDEIRDEVTQELKDGQSIIDNLFKIKTGSGIRTATAEAFGGANITGTIPAIKPNTNNHGYVFMTRPDLNLAPDNIRVSRQLSALANNDPKSILRAIAMILSPQLYSRFKDTKSNLVDPLYPFIAISDNLTKSLTGWPSGQLGIHTSQAGIAKEEHIQADSPAFYNGQYSLSLSMYNSAGNAGKMLFHYWTTYIGAVLKHSNGVSPWPEYNFNGRLDYTSRIYRLIMDESRTYVEEMCATNYFIPQPPDLGPHFNFDAEQPKPFIGSTVDVELACTGAIYYDELLVNQFNRTVVLFNPAMHNSVRGKHMTYVPKKYHTVFSGKSYPFIEPNTKELQWWTFKDTWDTMGNLRKMVDSNLIYL